MLIRGVKWCTPGLGIQNTVWKKENWVHSTEKKGQRGFCDGLGLFLGEKSRDFLSLWCEICECKGVPQAAGVPVLPVMQCVNDTIGEAVFQQDNAPVHTASVVTECFEQQNIQVDEHPPYSPDRMAAVIDVKGWYMRYWACIFIQFFSYCAGSFVTI